MMKTTRADGKVITDEMFDMMAKEYEEGSFQGRFGKAVMGRPRISEEKGVTIGFRLPHSMIVALDELATARGESRSELLRDMVKSELARV